MFLASTSNQNVIERDTVFPKMEKQIMPTAHLKASRISSRGRPLIATTLVLFATLALVPHAAFTIIAIMAMVGVKRAFT
jgi:hypothetical protein